MQGLPGRILPPVSPGLQFPGIPHEGYVQPVRGMAAFAPPSASRSPVLVVLAPSGMTTPGSEKPNIKPPSSRHVEQGVFYSSSSAFLTVAGEQRITRARYASAPLPPGPCAGTAPPARDSGRAAGRCGVPPPGPGLAVPDPLAGCIHLVGAQGQHGPPEELGRRWSPACRSAPGRRLRYPSCWTWAIRSCQPGRFMLPGLHLSPCAPACICSYFCR